MTWQLEQAETQFSELLDAALNEGAQVVTRDGAEVAVLVPVEQWRRLQGGRATLEDGKNILQGTPASLKDWLTAAGPTFEDMMIPERGGLRHREPPVL